MIDLTRLSWYRRWRRLIGRPLKAGGSYNFPEPYYLFVDVVEGRMIVKLMRDCGWGSEVKQVFDPRTPIGFMQECAEIHWEGELN